MGKNRQLLMVYDMVSLNHIAIVYCLYLLTAKDRLMMLKDIADFQRKED